MSFEIENVRSDFPVLSRLVADRPVVYFDNAATSLKPRRVIDAVERYLAEYSANIHRGKHLLSEEASEAYENSRGTVARFINAKRSEVIFVRGTTEAINLVAAGLSLAPDENVVGTILEHHSNILPWRCRAVFRAAPLTPAGLPDLDAAEALIDDKTRLVTVTHCSNVTGAVVPVDRWAAMAHHRGVPILVDGAQSAAHKKIDIRAIDCDYFAMSGHKMCGPTGAGVLAGKQESLERLSPAPIGGGSVSLVRMDFTYELRDLPWRLEAGTPDIAGVIGLAAAVDYLEQIGMENIERRNKELLESLDEHIVGLGLSALCPGRETERTCILSLVQSTPGVTPDYLSRLLSDSFGIMVRGGHHCAHPLHEYFNTAGSLRASLQFYNTKEEILQLRAALEQLAWMLEKRT